LTGKVPTEMSEATTCIGSGGGWKENWDETRRHFVDWWNHEGLVLSVWWGAPARGGPRVDLEAPPEPASVEESYTDFEARARRSHYSLACGESPADTLPIADTGIGPGSLALYVGSEPGFSKETVWFEPSMKDVADPEKLPPLEFDPENRWWKLTEATARACVELAGGDYLVGLPDLIENIDILAALRDPQTLLMDMIERPEWVEQKVEEINRAFFEAYARLYEIIKLPDGSSTFGPFSIWGPGKVAKVQCDASAMFSPDMFERFVLPALSRQCEWLDRSMFHLDGHQCIVHLDHLLSIDALDAVEWTPDPQVPPGGSPEWYPMYRKILAAGKSVQAIGVGTDEVVPLLDAVGGKGMYVAAPVSGLTEAEELVKRVEQFR
jgi:hypothetical protein